jgi:shikimate dehydrogenase
MPHKVALASLVDELDPIAKEIGAVNTVVNQRGTLLGYNTDWLGILRPLEQRTPLANKRVALLGAGGAAQAALYACTSHGAAVTIFNRTVSKAQSLGDAFRVPVLPLDGSQRFDDFEIIINTTSIGMGALAAESPIEAHQLSKHQIVFETIYHPFETQLLVAAQRCGATCIHGLEMFLEQGAAQFELHTGVKAPRAVMKTILQNALPS